MRASALLVSLVNYPVNWILSDVRKDKSKPSTNIIFKYIYSFLYMTVVLNLCQVNPTYKLVFKVKTYSQKCVGLLQTFFY